MLMMLMAMVLVTPLTSAYFWTDDPNYFDWDVSPPENSLDGWANAYVTQSSGSGMVFLTGGTEGTPAEITKTGEEDGLVLMWVVTYDVNVRLWNGQTSRAWIELDLNFKDGGQGPWQDADDDMAYMIKYIYSDPPWGNETGYLYVWADCAYDQDDEFELTLTAHAQWLDRTTWVDLALPVPSTSVYFVINEV